VQIVRELSALRKNRRSAEWNFHSSEELQHALQTSSIILHMPNDAKPELPFVSEPKDPTPDIVNGASEIEPADDSLPCPPSGNVSGKYRRQEFFLPISGFVWLYPEEVVVVNHPAFQRLSRIYQLGQAHLVFRGATHKRIEHVLGALHIVQRMVTAVRTNSEKQQEAKSSSFAPRLTNHEERFVRLGALLHDIGHLAAGHTIEDELGLVGKHDGDRRLEIIFDNVLNLDWLRDNKGSTLGALIDSQYEPWIREARFDAKKLSASTLVRLLIRKEPNLDSDPLSASRTYLVESNRFRLFACRDMIGNTICADLLDYIYRDWYHVGKPRPFDERLLQYMEIRARKGAPPRGIHDLCADDDFVIALGKPPKIRSDAVSHILELLEWRYSLAETVLFHRTKLAAAAMLDRVLYELWGDVDNEDELIKVLLPLSDEELLAESKRAALEKASKAKGQSKARYETAFRLLSALESRCLAKKARSLTA
jgi:HD superfamily phosphohydrolase